MAAEKGEWSEKSVAGLFTNFAFNPRVAGVLVLHKLPEKHAVAQKQRIKKLFRVCAV